MSWVIHCSSVLMEKLEGKKKRWLFLRRCLMQVSGALVLNSYCYEIYSTWLQNLRYWEKPCYLNEVVELQILKIFVTLLAWISLTLHNDSYVARSIVSWIRAIGCYYNSALHPVLWTRVEPHAKVNLDFSPWGHAAPIHLEVAISAYDTMGTHDTQGTCRNVYGTRHALCPFNFSTFVWWNTPGSNV